MGKPIPVFTFVFAAYAATSAPSKVSGRRSAIEELPIRDPFLDAWRTRSARKGDLFAKVGLLIGVATGDVRFAVRNSSEAFEELWLDGIAETRLGFIGAAMDGPALPPAIRPGQRMRFHRLNVLDWRLGDGLTATPTPQREFAKRHPREMLAALSETVGG